MQKNPQKVYMKIKKITRFKKKPLPIHVVKNTIYDQTQILTFQIDTDIENRTLTRLKSLSSFAAHKYCQTQQNS